MRSLLGASSATTKESDALFDKLDGDGSGELDYGELKLALKALEQAAARGQRRAASIRQRAGCWREQAEEALVVAEVTRHSEEALRKYQAAQDGSLGAQLGLLLKKKNIKIASIVQEWGGDDGEVDKSEWYQQLRGIGLAATREETDMLFSTLDEECVRRTALCSLLPAPRSLLPAPRARTGMSPAA